MNLVDTDSDNPFTLKPLVKGKDIKKHEIIIKHERTPDSLAATPTSSLTNTPKETIDPFEVELSALNRKISALDDILLVYDPEDAEYKEYKDKKRALLVYRFNFLNSASPDKTLFTPTK